MEIPPTLSPVHTHKNKPNTPKIIFYTLKKVFSKTKLLFNPNLIKQTKLATALTCRTTKLSFITPGDYEFSCTKTPIYSHQKFRNRRRRRATASVTVKSVEKVFEFLNTNSIDKREIRSPVLPGFGWSPVVRHLRVTDSPFPIVDSDDADGEVDKAAEEFISKFYKQLKMQKRIGSVGSTPPCYMRGR